MNFYWFFTDFDWLQEFGGFPEARYHLQKFFEELEADPAMGRLREERRDQQKIQGTSSPSAFPGSREFAEIRSFSDVKPDVKPSVVSGAYGIPSDWDTRHRDSNVPLCVPQKRTHNCLS
jgi:hypothetical protein